MLLMAQEKQELTMDEARPLIRSIKDNPDGVIFLTPPDPTGHLTVRKLPNGTIVSDVHHFGETSRFFVETIATEA